jgi:hypothetical protein
MQSMTIIAVGFAFCIVLLILLAILSRKTNKQEHFTSIVGIDPGGDAYFSFFDAKSLVADKAILNDMTASTIKGSSVHVKGQLTADIITAPSWKSMDFTANMLSASNLNASDKFCIGGECLTADIINTAMENESVVGVKPDGSNLTVMYTSGATRTFPLPQGLIGDKGEPGPKGQKGPEGEQGPRGPRGYSGNEGLGIADLIQAQTKDGKLVLSFSNADVPKYSVEVPYTITEDYVRTASYDTSSKTLSVLGNNDKSSGFKLPDITDIQFSSRNELILSYNNGDVRSVVIPSLSNIAIANNKLRMTYSDTENREIDLPFISRISTSDGNFTYTTSDGVIIPSNVKFPSNPKPPALSNVIMQSSNLQMVMTDNNVLTTNARLPEVFTSASFSNGDMYVNTTRARQVVLDLRLMPPSWSLQELFGVDVKRLDIRIRRFWCVGPSVFSTFSDAYNKNDTCFISYIAFSGKDRLLTQNAFTEERAAPADAVTPMSLQVINDGTVNNGLFNSSDIPKALDFASPEGINLQGIENTGFVRMDITKANEKYGIYVRSRINGGSDSARPVMLYVTNPDNQVSYIFTVRELASRAAPSTTAYVGFYQPILSRIQDFNFQPLFESGRASMDEFLVNKPLLTDTVVDQNKFLDLEYPPMPLTSVDQVVNTTSYGRGRYTVTASSVADGSSPHNVFDENNDTEYVSGDEIIRTSAGTSNGKSTTLLPGNRVYPGGWIELTLPSPIYATKFKMRVRNVWAAPITWVVLGKLRETDEWIILNEQGWNQAHYRTPEYISYDLNGPHLVSIIRICTHRVATVVRSEYRISDIKIIGGMSTI